MTSPILLPTKILEPPKYAGDVVRVFAQPILEYFAPSVLTHKL